MPDPATQKNILLVEDDPLLIDIYTTKLHDLGFEVRVVESGDEVMKEVEAKAPDLVVLDIVLPRVDGWQVLSQLKKDARFKQIAVVILSNLGQKEEIEKGLRLGADLYLIKAHYTPTQIGEQISKMLQAQP